METRTRIAGLKAEQLRLQDELRSLLPDDAKLLEAPPGGLLIGLPTSLIRVMVAEALTGPLKQVRLRLEDVVKVELEDVLRKDTFLGNLTLGRYDLAVDVKEVTAVLKPGTPTLSFGSNRISVSLPVATEAGRVKATLAFKWDGRRIAGLVCGDLSREHELRARVPPVQVTLRGRFEIEARGESVRVRPVLAPVDLAFRVEPPDETWEFIEEVVKSRNALCEAALRRAHVSQKVADLLSRGFKVRLPNTWVRPLTLPASFRDTFDVQGRSAGLVVLPTGVSLTKTRIWYGANLSLRREAPQSGAKR